jgi:hypothetical protein
MLYSIKIVPDAEPNAEGKWIEVVSTRGPVSGRWTDITFFFDTFIPKGYHMVQITGSPRFPETKPSSLAPKSVRKHGNRFSGLDI